MNTFRLFLFVFPFLSLSLSFSLWGMDIIPQGKTGMEEEEWIPLGQSPSSEDERETVMPALSKGKQGDGPSEPKMIVHSASFKIITGYDPRTLERPVSPVNEKSRRGTFPLEEQPLGNYWGDKDYFDGLNYYPSDENRKKAAEETKSLGNSDFKIITGYDPLALKSSVPPENEKSRRGTFPLEKPLEKSLRSSWGDDEDYFDGLNYYPSDENRKKAAEETKRLINSEGTYDWRKAVIDKLKDKPFSLIEWGPAALDLISRYHREDPEGFEDFKKEKFEEITKKYPLERGDLLFFKYVYSQFPRETSFVLDDFREKRLGSDVVEILLKEPSLEMAFQGTPFDLEALLLRTDWETYQLEKLIPFLPSYLERYAGKAPGFLKSFTAQLAQNHPSLVEPFLCQMRWKGSFSDLSNPLFLDMPLRDPIYWNSMVSGLKCYYKQVTFVPASFWDFGNEGKNELCLDNCYLVLEMIPFLFSNKGDLAEVEIKQVLKAILELDDQTLSLKQKEGYLSCLKGGLERFFPSLPWNKIFDFSEKLEKKASSL